ncbi:MAG: GGDEF domain-containing protein, partial [Thalassotalea sp.]
MIISPSNEAAIKANIPFREFLMLQCLPLRKWALLSAFFLYAIFALLDVLKLPEAVYQISLTTRFFLVFLPLTILNYIYWFKAPRSILDHSWLLLLVYLGAGINHSIINYYVTIYQLPFSQLGLVLIMMFGCLLLVLPVIPTLICTIIILSVYGLSSYYLDRSAEGLLINLFILCFLTSLYLLINWLCQMILLDNYRLIRQLYGESITDGLTQLYNKRFFEGQLERLSLQSKRESTDVSILLVDIDHFKSINDQHGHLEGDRIMQEIALVLKSLCRRPFDYACRIGGDEFAIIYYGITQKRLQEVSSELLKNTTTIKLKNSMGSLTNVTVSVGAATQLTPEETNYEDLIEQADQALYQAKANGRNAYVIS